MAALGLAVAGAVTLADSASAGEGAADTDTSIAGQQPAGPPGAGTLPRAGVVHFGESLGGVSLRMSREDVVATWGRQFGVCRSCASETWYFTYREFNPEGAGVEFDAGGATALFTLWQPEGWRSAGGLVLGTALDDIPSAYLELPRIDCGGYEAFVHERSSAKTALYVHDDRLWAYGVMISTEPVCR